AAELHREDGVAGAAGGVRDRVGVAPDLAIESAAARVEDSHHLPLAASDRDRLPHQRSLVPADGGSAEHHLVGGPLWNPALDDLDRIRAQELAAVFRHAAKSDIRAPASVDALVIDGAEQP